MKQLRQASRALRPLCLLALLVGLTASCGLFRVSTWQERGRAFEDDQTWMLQNMSELYPSRTISRAGEIASFERAPVELADVRFTLDGEERSFEEFWETNHSTGMAVLHRGRLVYERYDQGADETTRFTSWSVAKSFTSTLVGLALADGAIASLDDPLERYIPEVAGTGYEGVTVAQTLQMSSGVAFSEEYENGGSDVIDFMTDTLITNRKRANSAATDYPRLHEPGTLFNYNTAETQVLGWLVLASTGKKPAAYLEEKLWRHLGMEHDASWLLDSEGPDGMEMAGCCINMALRDMARFGQLFLQDGVWRGQRLLPEGWVARATQPDAPHLVLESDTPYTETGYQYQWWIVGTGAYSAEGVNGQFIYVDPTHDLVIAKTSSWPDAWTKELAAEAFAAFDAIAQHLSR